MTENFDNAFNSKATQEPGKGSEAKSFRESPAPAASFESNIIVTRYPKVPTVGPRPTDERGPVLFVRIDRIGDLVLSLPTDGQFPLTDHEGERNVDWWIAEGLGFIADHAVPRRRVREMRTKINFEEFKTILKEVKARKYQRAIVLHAPWWVSVLLWLARIPSRVGPRSQWHSFIFLNDGIRQKRSLAAASELEYNFRVMDSVADLPPLSREPLKLSVDSEWKLKTLSQYDLENEKYSVVHPGMGGSARNWATSHYISWIQDACKSEKIVITGTEKDEVILEPIRQALAGTRNIEWLNGKLSGPQLLHVLDGARCVLAPSTGVAHLAASLGRPTVGIYSPVKVQQPARWAPQGPSVQVLVPDVECPGKKSCLGQACAHYDCMNRISLESVRSVWSAKS